jgi:CheY-like chemotaxis protein
MECVMGYRAGTLVAKRLAGVRVLAVEDHDDSREVLAELLSQQGAAVTAVATVEEAFAALDRVRPDVIVSDLCLPSHTGLELMERVRVRPVDRGGRVPAVALTAHSDPALRDEALSVGFEEYLVKPIDPALLVAAIGRLLGPKVR